MGGKLMAGDITSGFFARGNVMIAGRGLGSGIAGVPGATPKFVCVGMGIALEWKRVN